MIVTWVHCKLCWFYTCQGMRETLLMIEQISLLSQLYIRVEIGNIEHWEVLQSKVGTQGSRPKTATIFLTLVSLKLRWRALQCKVIMIIQMCCQIIYDALKLTSYFAVTLQITPNRNLFIKYMLSYSYLRTSVPKIGVMVQARCKLTLSVGYKTWPFYSVDGIIDTLTNWHWHQLSTDLSALMSPWSNPTHMPW